MTIDLQTDPEADAEDRIHSLALILTGSMQTMDALTAIDYALHTIATLPREYRHPCRCILAEAAAGWIATGERATSRAINDSIPF